MENLENWNKLSTPPPSALKKITGGRVSGMTNISPQWRYQAMTETYGPCGVGWKFAVVKKWTEPGTNGQIFAFVDIDLFIKNGDVWSEPIPGNGGSMLVTKEKSGLFSDDEAYKKATTDALSTAMKLLGVGADIYLGNWDGSKYTNHGSYNNNSNHTPQAGPKKLPSNKNLDHDTERYKSRLEGTVQYGLIYVRKCWRQTPEGIQRAIGNDFKIALYRAAEDADTAHKQGEAAYPQTNRQNSLSLKKPHQKETDRNQTENSLHSSPAFKKYAEAKEMCPDIAATLPEPTTTRQCLEAVKIINQEADKQA